MMLMYKFLSPGSALRNIRTDESSVDKMARRKQKYHLVIRLEELILKLTKV